MKSIKMLSLVGALILLLSNCSKTNNPAPQQQQQHLIANYPLTSDGVDLTGLNGPMTLKNTPFQNSGMYCNGIYVYSPDSNYCLAQSPPIDSFHFDSFSISMDFFVTEKKTQPVWVIGTGCRWLGFYLYNDGTISLLYNNANFLTTPKAYSLNKWQNAKITYDGTTASIYLDDALAASLKFGNGYVTLDYGSCGSADTEIGITNYSNGAVLKGFIRNLKVYSPQ